MRENICIILNSKNKNDALKEMNEVIKIFREDCHLDTEYKCHELYNKSELEKDYEGFKQEYRNLPELSLRRRMKAAEVSTVEEYIDFVLKLFNWDTLEKYVKSKYNIVRFEGDTSIGLYNPRGYIDYVDHVIEVKKYKFLKSKDIKKFRLSSVILKDTTDINWDSDKNCKDNSLMLRQVLRRNAKPDDYIAVVRVHF